MQQCSTKTICMGFLQTQLFNEDFNDQVSVISIISSHLRHPNLSFQNYKYPNCQSLIRIRAVKTNLCHGTTFPCYRFVPELLLQIHAFRYVFTCPPSPLTGNSCNSPECTSEAFPVLQMTFEHFLSSLHITNFFFSLQHLSP